MQKRFFYSNSYESFVGLLNLYPGANVAYSFRKLNTNYNGPCIKVRRSPDNQELDINFNNNEIDITSLTNFVGLGNAFVVTWYDQSGNDNHLTQSIATYQPFIISNGVMELDNGLPAIRFNLPYRRLNLTNQILLEPINTSYTIQHRLFDGVASVALNDNSTTRPTTPIIFIDNSIYNNVQKLNDVKYYSSNLVAAIRNNFLLISNISDDTTSIIRINSNNLSLTGPAYMSNPINKNLISLGSYASSQINSRISELILYQETKSLSDNLEIENNINEYYGIY